MQYTPFASDVELPFYMALASRKINHDKLDDSAHRVLGLYEIRPTDSPNTSCRVQVHGNALTSNQLVYSPLTPTQNIFLSRVAHYTSAPIGYYRAEGMIKNVNTIEEYRNMDKAHMLEQAGKTVKPIRQPHLGSIN